MDADDDDDDDDELLLADDVFKGSVSNGWLSLVSMLLCLFVAVFFAFCYSCYYSVVVIVVVFVVVVVVVSLRCVYYRKYRHSSNAFILFKSKYNYCKYCKFFSI